MRNLYLVCNAHLDPVWLWEWEEGAAEAIATFRTAADLCEEFDGFVFNHNEAVLYRWVEEYAPELFRRIRRLVAEGRWHIMGGWYLQPDCNMPSGESLVRQIRAGRDYFRDRFGAEPRTAINFDPFGHSRGLVQIMAKSGYTSYIFCRPGNADCPLPSDRFRWQGFDGSSIVGVRVSSHYNSGLGKAVDKIGKWLNEHPDTDPGLVLWGVGDHGGGPSRRDLEAIARLMAERKDVRISHAVPEEFCEALDRSSEELPVHAGDINPWAVGCYTSQIRIKQKHRELENLLYSAEKMLSAAAVNGLLDFPESEIGEAERDLLFSEFHDILPGSGIKPVEEGALRTLGHGLEIASRLRARAFFALAASEKPGTEDRIPVFFFNPHPYPMEGIFESEFQLADQNWGDDWTIADAYIGGSLVPCQIEQELSNLNLDWRKRVVVSATLAAGALTRIDCVMKRVPARPRPASRTAGGPIVIENPDMRVVIDSASGLVREYVVGGRRLLTEGAFKPVLMADSDDPWEMSTDTINTAAGEFTLMTPERAAWFAGVETSSLDPVRVVEDGPVRTVVEALFEHGNSFIVLSYHLPKRGTEIRVDAKVYWNERRMMLKLSLPTGLPECEYLGQTAFGVQSLPDGFREAAAQKWCGVFSRKADSALTCVNDGVYGVSCGRGEIRLSLLRSAGYAVHPIGDRPRLPDNRFSPRIDQGERWFSFWVNGGDRVARLENADREALGHNEKPFGLSFNPGGEGKAPLPLAEIEGDAVIMPAFCKRSGGYVFRLFEPSGTAREVTVRIPALGVSIQTRLGPFEVRTYEADLSGGGFRETDMTR